MRGSGSAVCLKNPLFSGPYLRETEMGFKENKSCWVQILQNDFALSSQGVGVVESKWMLSKSKHEENLVLNKYGVFSLNPSMWGGLDRITQGGGLCGLRTYFQQGSVEHFEAHLCLQHRCFTEASHFQLSWLNMDSIINWNVSHKTSWEGGKMNEFCIVYASSTCLSG